MPARDAETPFADLPAVAFDDDEEDDFEDDWGDYDECGLRHDGQCGLAGSEWCDFECPNRDSDLFAGSEAWMKKHGLKP
jgi:hypothetical protein